LSTGIKSIVSKIFRYPHICTVGLKS
jgi:hypothetical protein